MFKRISAALLAVSVLAAPALAATSGKTDQAPVTTQAFPEKETDGILRSGLECLAGLVDGTAPRCQSGRGGPPSPAVA